MNSDKQHEEIGRGKEKAHRKKIQWLPVFVVALFVFVISLRVTKALMDFKIARAPYPAFGKTVAWLLGSQEPAYNFNVVVPGKIYRSSNPDPAFLDHVTQKYGVKTVVSLAGPQPWFEYARAKGLVVNDYAWGTSKLPPRDELVQVQAILESATPDDPILVHCSAGADRTGYAVALYRVQFQGWSQEDAVEEMRNYWHFPEKKEVLHNQISEYLTPHLTDASGAGD